MSQMDSKNKATATVPVRPTPVYRHSIHNQYYKNHAAGEPQRVPVQSSPPGTQNQPLTAMMQEPQNPSGAPKFMLDSLQTTGTAGDLTAYQLRNPSARPLQGVAAAAAHSSQMPVEEALQKRELRLMKNREAARECRRKKKEYVKCLENRVAVLENQNRTLIEELRVLKDIYRHKAE